jgi:hypothetical protein
MLIGHFLLKVDIVAVKFGGLLFSHLVVSVDSSFDVRK